MRRVLVIDDDKDYAGNLARIFGTSDFRIVGASPMEAVAAAKREKPRLIFLDLCLDGAFSHDTRSAEHLLGAIKVEQALHHIPIIAISGKFHDPETEARLKDLGAKSFIPKPEIDGDRLLKELGGATDFPEKMRDLPFELTILVIDDEDDSARLLEAMLKDQPYRILWARDGRSGLAAAAGQQPDLVVLDLHLPGLDGGEICRRLRGRDQALYLPILMLTGDERAEVECLRLGADDYLRKDQPADVLMARLDNLIRRRRFGLKDGNLARIGGVELDPIRRSVAISGRQATITLRPRESSVLLLLMAAAGDLVESRALHEKAQFKGPYNPDSSSVRMQISNLKRQLGNHRELVEAVQKRDGYRFNVQLAESLAKGRPAG